MSTFKPRCAPSAPSSQDRHRTWRRLTSMLALTVVGLFAVGMALAEDDERDDEAGASTLTIERAAWDSREHRLRVSGQGTARAKVTVVNAYAVTQKLGTDSAERNGAWSISKQLPRPVPCRVRATLTDGQTVERAVDKAPADCAPKAPGTGTPPPVTTNQAPTAKANGRTAANPAWRCVSAVLARLIQTAALPLTLGRSAMARPATKPIPVTLMQRRKPIP
ncbi:hypothetical protein [Chromatium okenii]|uniref:hypothetical protein n=1 Tax=Chromatium okenii TaxID=61644 RepID=UPI001F5B808D|nr:hypothetical protein [Chromatium okenii]